MFKLDFESENYPTNLPTSLWKLKIKSMLYSHIYTQIVRYSIQITNTIHHISKKMIKTKYNTNIWGQRLQKIIKIITLMQLIVIYIL